MAFYRPGEKITASKPKFRLSEFSRRKLAGAVHVTEELIADAPQLAATFSRLYGLEAAFVKKCPICGGKLPESAGPGRPRKFCSPACSRAAELEIRRVNARLERLEDRLSECRASEVASFDSPKLLEAEIARQHAHLLELLADASGAPPRFEAEQ
jgi:hypothetical protein